MEITKKLRLTLDSWYNAVTGLGTNFDKTQAALFKPSAILSDNVIKALIKDDDLSRKIVMKKPKEMIRQGWTIKGQEESDKEKIQAVIDKADDLNFVQELFTAMWLGRAYGGALLIMGIEGAGLPDEPLSEDVEIDRIVWLQVVDRRYVQPVRVGDELIAFMSLENPELYRIGFTQSEIPTGSLVHKDRVIRLGGAITDPETKRENEGWDLSVLQEAFDVLSQYSQIWQGLTNAMTDWSQAVFKLKGLMSMIAEGKEQTLQKRMQIVNMARSMARAVLVDADTEEFSRDNTSFSGIEGILDQAMMRLASVVEMPVTLLFGRSPAGMNATGDADFRNFYDTIKTDQMLVLMPELIRFYGLLFKSRDLKGEPDQWNIEFNPLWQMTEQELSEVRNKQANTDATYIDREVVLPEEIALSRFGAEGYRTETEIDIELRIKALEQMKEESEQEQEQEQEESEQEQEQEQEEETGN
jgi:phage-related protein (TIGR01555 family)